MVSQDIARGLEHSPILPITKGGEVLMERLGDILKKTMGAISPQKGVDMTFSYFYDPEQGIMVRVVYDDPDFASPAVYKLFECPDDWETDLGAKRRRLEDALRKNQKLLVLCIQTALKEGVII